jgi:hypothetical protein
MLHVHRAVLLMPSPGTLSSTLPMAAVSAVIPFPCCTADMVPQIFTRNKYGTTHMRLFDNCD